MDPTDIDPDPDRSDDDMTATLSELPVEEIPSADVDDLEDDAYTSVGSLGDDPEAEIDVATDLEQELLSALMWAPPAIARAVTAQLDTKHFWIPQHARIFAAIAAVATNAAPSPALVNAQLLATGGQGEFSTRSAQQTMLSLVAPTHRPVAVAGQVPYLAIAVIDGWYRRGYTALLTAMDQRRQEASIEELSGYWAQLTRYQQRAESEWLTRRQALTEVE
ncbi:DnaB-like helicase N-terminal domain-containing protein [Gordonia sputi]